MQHENILRLLETGVNDVTLRLLERGAIAADRLSTGEKWYFLGVLRNAGKAGDKAGALLLVLSVAGPACKNPVKQTFGISKVFPCVLKKLYNP
jgi:hypothetical protein